MSTRIINVLARRMIGDRQVFVLDSRKCRKGQRVVVHANGRLVEARVVSAGEWPIAVCDNGTGEA
jgi:hypothetical protein